MDTNEEGKIVHTSRFIAYVLRHRPDAAGITLDEHGWANVDELVSGVNAHSGHHLTRELLERIVATDEKGRYSFNDDHTKIRANQGHSIPVDVEMTHATPPEVLYHGTGEKYADSIDREGLLPMGRLYVHLSPDIPTALKVGSRHGVPVVYAVAAGRMARDGHAFLLSANNVWQTKAVPPRYLTRLPAPESAGM